MCCWFRLTVLKYKVWNNWTPRWCIQFLCSLPPSLLIIYSEMLSWLSCSSFFIFTNSRHPMSIYLKFSSGHPTFICLEVLLTSCNKEGSNNFGERVFLSLPGWLLPGRWHIEAWRRHLAMAVGVTRFLPQPVDGMEIFISANIRKRLIQKIHQVAWTIHVSCIDHIRICV